eukprot:2382900-Alexandrium_andersonii.AAC.1
MADASMLMFVDLDRLHTTTDAWMEMWSTALAKLANLSTDGTAPPATHIKAVVHNLLSATASKEQAASERAASIKSEHTPAGAAPSENRVTISELLSFNGTGGATDMHAET